MKCTGDCVRQTGLYTVSHRVHRAAHQAILCAGETFPACRVCGEHAVFQYLGPAPESDEFEHLSYDRDFLESVLSEYDSARLTA